MGSRAGDRLALTLISLTLDEVDATEVQTGAEDAKANVRASADPVSPSERLIAKDIVPAIAKPGDSLRGQALARMRPGV